jgi:hypothetical protein
VISGQCSLVEPKPRVANIATVAERSFSKATPRGIPAMTVGTSKILIGSQMETRCLGTASARRRSVDGKERFEQRLEELEVKRVGTIGFRACWIVVNFEEETVDAGGDGGARQ